MPLSPPLSPSPVSPLRFIRARNAWNWPQAPRGSRPATKNKSRKGEKSRGTCPFGSLSRRSRLFFLLLPLTLPFTPFPFSLPRPTPSFLPLHNKKKQPPTNKNTAPQPTSRSRTRRPPSNTSRPLGASRRRSPGEFFFSLSFSSNFFSLLSLCPALLTLSLFPHSTDLHFQKK